MSELEFLTRVSSQVLFKALETSPFVGSCLLLLELAPDGSALPVERPLVCECLGKFVLPRPLWTRASEYSILQSGGLGEDKGYRATRLFVSSSTET